MKASGGAAPRGNICLGSSGLHHACAHIIKHNMKYSLLLPLDTVYFRCHQGGLLLRNSALSKTLGGWQDRELGRRWRNATQTLLRGVTGEIKMCAENKRR